MSVSTPERAAKLGDDCAQAEWYFSQHNYRLAYHFFCRSWRVSGYQENCACRIAACLYRLGKKQWAFNWLLQCLNTNRQQVHLWVEMGIFWKHEGELKKAKKCLKKALWCQSDNFYAHYNIAIVYSGLSDFANAIRHAQHAVKLHPGSAEAYNALGNAYKAQHDYMQAIAHYQASLKRDPSCADAWGNLAACLEATGHASQARRYYERALEHSPDSDAIGANYALCCLRECDFQTGWHWYEKRKKAAGSRIGILQYPFLEWRGEDLSGKTLLLWGEQGLGDHIMPLFWITRLQQLFPRLRIVLQIDQRLKELVMASFSSTTGSAIQFGFSGKPNGIDFQSSLWSLFRFFIHEKADLKGLSAISPCLSLDNVPGKQGIEQILKPYPERKIAIAWRSANTEWGTIRSCPLAYWKPFLASLPRTSVFSVQYAANQYAEEVAAHGHATGQQIIQPDMDTSQDMNALAHFLSKMDSVVTIDNTTVHLAGALGIPTVLLLPFHADWRWFSASENRSYWYPSVQIVRQTRLGDWSTVWERARSMLLWE